jgi:hypothetical protein
VLTIARPASERTIVRVAPAKEAVVSWNSSAPAGKIDLTVYRADGQVSTWLPYIIFDENGRRSLSGGDDVARISTDIIKSDEPILAVEVRSDVPLDAVAVSTPVPPATNARLFEPLHLDVPALSQYLADRPDARGWCSPTSLAMLLAYWNKPHDLPAIVDAVYDENYGGTGNWAFNMAFAGSLGLRAAVVHLAGLDHAARFIAAGIPLALSYAWNGDELPGAPLDHSGGHLAVLRGFTRHGHPQINDPAQHEMVTTYDKVALERVWRAHGGIAYAVVPPEREAELLDLTNA